MTKLRWVDGQAFADYSEWECFLEGFHNVRFSEEAARQSRDLYLDMEKLLAECMRVLEKWPVTTAVHLSKARNHKAWMGHAACFVHHGAGADSSVAAYWMLDDSGRDNANNCVMEAVTSWRANHEWLLSGGSSRRQNCQQGFLF